MWPGLLVPPQMRHRWDAVAATHPSQLARPRAPRGQEQSPQPLWGQRGRPWPCCLVFSCRVGPAPFPLCLGHPQKGRRPRQGTPKKQSASGTPRWRRAWTPASRVGRELFTRLLLFLHSISLSPPDAWAGLALDSAGIEGLLVGTCSGTCRPTEGPSACGWVASRPEQRRQEQGKWRLRRTGRQGAGTRVGGGHRTSFWAQSTANPPSGTKGKE